MKQIKVLKQFPRHLRCPLCGTNKSAKTLLVPVIEEGRKEIRKIIAVHKRCALEGLMYNQKADMFFILPKVPPEKVKHKSG